MADSNITKRALATALREIMKETSFDKINVAHICDRCGMNRKSFYYHFRDKYDLVNWIFDTEMITLMKDLSDDRWDALEGVCGYFFDNRDFYRKALQIKGQNSLSEHLRKFLYPLIHNRIEKIIGQDDVPQLCIDFIADGFICSIERWLLDKNCMSAEEFVSILKQIVQAIAVEIYGDIYQDKQ